MAGGIVPTVPITTIGGAEDVAPHARGRPHYRIGGI